MGPAQSKASGISPPGADAGSGKESRGVMQYNNILYCTDYSEDAEIALVHAADLARRHGATLHVLHVLKSRHRYLPTETYEGQEEGEVAMVTPELVEEAVAKLKQHYGPRLQEVAQVHYQVVAGTAFVEILRYARDKAIDLIVLGAAGESEKEPTHYGSTVEQVSRQAHCAVMAIRNPEKTYTL